MKVPLLTAAKSPLGIGAENSAKNTRPTVRRQMVRIGQVVPRFPRTVVVSGDCRPLDALLLRERWIALCFPEQLNEAEMLRLNHYASLLSEAGAILLAALSDDTLLAPRAKGYWRQLRVPVVVDPLGRLHRSYGIVLDGVDEKSSTFLIDPNHVLKHHLVHELNSWDMDAVHRLLLLELEHARHPRMPAAVSLERSHTCRI